jgi:succinate dehydrogenase/fumarate reductase flavoprotein subunit
MVMFVKITLNLSKGSTQRVSVHVHPSMVQIVLELTPFLKRLLFGRFVGKTMVNEIDTLSLYKATEADAMRMIDEMTWVLTNNGQESVQRLREELQQSMSDNAGVFRTLKPLSHKWEF